MGGQPNNRAIGKLQHFNVHGIPTELIRQMRVYAVIEQRLMSELTIEAFEMWLKEKKKKSQ